MRFTYTYRSSDGQRHAAEIDAPSRDAAFVRLREEFGIRAIKVVAREGGGPSRALGHAGRSVAALGSRAAGVVAVGLVVLALLAGGAWLLHFQTRRPVPDSLPASYDNMPQAASASRGPQAARPRPRMQIEGFGGIDLGKAFPRAAERFLAHYAQPGERTVGGKDPLPEGLAEDIIVSLREPILIGEGDPANVRSLKGVVAGIKSDVLLLMASGQTIGDVLAWLENRQGMEASYRDRIVAGLKARPSAKDEVNRLLRSLGLREVK